MQSQLLTNNWFGKAVGATCAWIWAPADPLWLAAAIICGISLGHLYDLWASHKTAAQQDKLAASSAQDKRQPHLQFLFTAMGRIAKAGGRVRPAHLNYATQLMLDMSMDNASRKQAQGWFNAGKQSHYDFKGLARECLQTTPATPQTLITILRCMCHMTHIELSDESLNCLKQLGGDLGFTPPEIAAEFGQVHSPQARAYKTEQAASDPKLVAAFECLGVTPGTSAAKIKLAYRKQVSKHHPDKLPPNASIPQRQHAQDQMVRLREALELIQSTQM
jgi:DnaJ like chaperone protein